MQDRLLVLSKLKQTNFATILTDGNLQSGKRISPEAPLFAQPDIQRWTNRDLSMKGHDYATQMQQVQVDLADSLPLVGDSWLLGWAFAMAMGKVTSSQPNAGGAPTAWQHIIEPLDPSTDGKDLPVTTIYTEVANVAGLKRRIKSVHVRGITLEYPPSAPLRLSVDLVGSGEITTGALASPPSLMTLVPLMSNNMAFLYGTQAAPADITTEIVRGSVKLGFSWNLDDENARHPGGGLYRSRAWEGRPDITLEFQRLVDDAAATPHDEFLADTIREVKFTVTGPLIAASEFHKIEVRGLAVVPEAVKVGQSGDKSVYQYTVGPTHWLKQGAADVINVTVENLETSYLV